MTDLVDVVVPVMVIGFVALVAGVAVFQGIPSPEATPAASVSGADLDRAQATDDDEIDIEDVEVPSNTTVEPEDGP